MKTATYLNKRKKMLNRPIKGLKSPEKLLRRKGDEQRFKTRFD